MICLLLIQVLAVILGFMQVPLLLWRFLLLFLLLPISWNYIILELEGTLKDT